MRKVSLTHKFGIVIVLVYLFLIIGEIRCIVKAINCNWEPIGKAEVIYTAAACTGLGTIIGWFNIKDN